MRGCFFRNQLPEQGGSFLDLVIADLITKVAGDPGYGSNSGLDPFQCPLSESRHSAPGGGQERDRRVRERSLRSDDALGRFRCLKAFDDQPDA
jgi:hypothetical protein